MGRFPLTPTLETIREVLESCYDRYPEHCCYTATRAVHDVFGLAMVAGHYQFPDEADDQGNTAKEDHFWNVDPINGLYVDITQDQFAKRAHKAIPRIIIAPKEQLTDLVEDWTPEMLPKPLTWSVAEALRKAFPYATIPERPSMQRVLQSAAVQS